MNRIAAIVAGLSLAFVGTSNAWAQLGAGACCMPSADTWPGGANCVYFDDLFAEDTCIELGGDFHAGQSCSEAACPFFLNPGDSIQAAINASSNGDVINLAAGTYNEDTINTGGKAITIQGTVNSDGTMATTIDAQQNGSVFLFNSGEGNDTLITTLVITGGYAADGGGGIYCELSSNPTITGCTIESNSAEYGGGINCVNSNPFISNCTITDNSATEGGGGIACESYSSPTITDCTISGNFANRGGGIFSENFSNPTITDCTISDNAAAEGSNIFGTYTSLRGETSPSIITLENSTICGTGEHISGVLIEHRGENHISDCTDDGDVNGDGAIDSTDLDAMHAAVGICTSDVNHDGDTNVLDLLGVIDEWGGVCP